jgi:outer membrane protein OmpA-like peptidoglycan-associated protein
MIQRQKRPEPLNSRGLRPIALVVVLASVLAACSSVPDWANPSRLYDRVSGVFTGDEGDGAFPTASAVPDRPETTTAAARQQTAQGLVADRENAQYTDDEIRRDEPAQVAAVAPAPRPAPPPRPATQEATTAPAPAQQVAQAPARPSLLDSRRVAPRGTASTPAANDTLDSRRTITSGRTTPPAATAAPAPVAPRVVERRAPAPAAVPRAPVAVAQAPAPVAPAPSAPPVAAQRTTPRLVLPAQPTVAVGPGQTLVSQTFARLLQDSASTVSTAPANASFSLPSAAPIQAGERPVSPIVRDTYNAALVATSRSITRTASAQPAAFQGQAASGSAAVSVQFGHDSARIPRASRATVRQIAEQYKARGGVIRVVGHASSKTKNMPVAEHNLANFKVSLDRAQTVANELIRLGVPPDAIFVEARGASDPAFFESMPAGEAGNRRAEIFLDFSTS